jgi:lipopolysaccharide/colanic/teichoic acid biosynthesis glycosyltransferase
MTIDLAIDQVCSAEMATTSLTVALGLQEQQQAPPNLSIPRPECLDLDRASARAMWRMKVPLPIVRPQGNRSRRYLSAKRVLDVLGALVALLVFSPVLLIACVVLTVTTRGRPFFVQTRVGFLGQRFRMLKFRTMRSDADRLQHTVENEHGDGPIFKNRRDPRITRFGGFLRRTSIDELPQLLNVLAGHMSLVGPRPPVPEEVAEYLPWQRRRLSIMPGLTCLWQVSGRSEIGFHDWVRMDLWYVDHQSLLTDLRLLALTPWSVLTGRGAY